VTNKSHPNIHNYVTVSTDNLTNLRTEKLCKFLNSFNSEWRREFENIVSDEEKDAVNSVVSNRNHIAHGQDVGVTYVSVLKWYKNIKKVVEKISIIINP
jgi:hypothetical protein